jgi:tetratricopeptide (TPR) repeat protein
LKVKSDDTEGALADLREAASAQPGREMIFKQIGDLKKARGTADQAAKAYAAALENTRDRSALRRLRGKMRVGATRR